MAKKSKPCSYTGHMHTMKKINVEKQSFDELAAQKAKEMIANEHQDAKLHQKKGFQSSYPKNKAHTPSCKKCI